MRVIVQKVGPVAVGLVLFLVAASIAQHYLEPLKESLSTNTHAFGMFFFFLLGIASVLIPFGSILPFMPIATSLWGWPVTGLITASAWIVGSQLLFEGSRRIGKPFVQRFLDAKHMRTAERLVRGKGLLRSILIRQIAHGDMVSYGFGLFSDINSFEFFIVTAMGVTPGAFVYAYFGSLPLPYMFGLAGIGLLCVAVYWLWASRIEEKQ